MDAVVRPEMNLHEAFILLCSRGQRTKACTSCCLEQTKLNLLLKRLGFPRTAPMHIKDMIAATANFEFILLASVLYLRLLKFLNQVSSTLLIVNL